jgi:GNAT superfamily N-acetyltransferase
MYEPDALPKPVEDVFGEIIEDGDPEARSGLREERHELTTVLARGRKRTGQGHRHPRLGIRGRPGHPLAVSGSTAISDALPRIPCGVRRQSVRREDRLEAREFSAVALWLPPHVEPDGDAIVATLTESVAPGQHEDMLSVLGQMDEAHPRFPHWYLPWFGVDGAMQGRGLGGELMKHCLRIVDEDHQPAYLETPNPRTISFYVRHGFVVTGEARSGACPPVVSMLRAAE